MECGQTGALQTRGTCWFYSIMNGLLLTEDGQKILYANMMEYYRGLSGKEKAEFDRQGGPIACSKSKMSFFKFVDKYLCYLSGPRSRSMQGRMSANVLKNHTFVGRHANKYKGLEGADPYIELANILEKVGIEYTIDPFGIPDDRLLLVPMTVLSHVPDYRLMCANFSVFDSEGEGHAFVGYTCGGKYYLFDSNVPKPLLCDWRNVKNVERLLPMFSDRYKKKYVKLVTHFSLYTNPKYTAKIHPSCRWKKLYSVNYNPLGPKYNSLGQLEKNKSKLKPYNYLIVKKYLRKKAPSPVKVLSPAKAPSPMSHASTASSRAGPVLRPTKVPKSRKVVMPASNSGKFLNFKRRVIHVGPRGGVYVVGPTGKKLYNRKPRYLAIK